MFSTVCPACQKVALVPKTYLNQTVRCDKCGGEFKAEETVAPILASPSNLKKPEVSWAAIGLLFLAVFSVLAWIVYLEYQEAEAEREGEEILAKIRKERAEEWAELEAEIGEKLANPEQDSAKGGAGSSDAHGAWAYMQIAVEQRLKNPSSASFPFGGHRSVEPLGGGRYRVSSYVDARNSFGAEIRTNFSGVIKKVSGGWQIESLELLE